MLEALVKVKLWMWFVDARNICKANILEVVSRF
jgi:hypothetical protein